eukprot:CAMPEP_0202486622 /NCGR_PEP_ID=MMETSP1361-20130828/5131_1 /ASSEMBLY_ACC=CAM_ASM_000849 /TAXON_ID=210615 /ORGANISM="Staurosira complex sp., Strain CCMP2646" /LENGTH=220 /DNA_ID=CAMNT_0049115805 /DNA_START=15 /DNA_END=677 /DNA_ORIENTATION=-
MCRGHARKSSFKALQLLRGVDQELKLQQDDSVKTLRTETSWVSSLMEEEPVRKSCLKVKTQQESLNKSTAVATCDKTVYFSTMEIHTHALRLGDNPCVASGAPLTIAWNAEFTTSVSVDDYEEAHPDRRSREELKVPQLVRAEWLRDEGYARSELLEAQAKAMRIQRARLASTKDSLGMEESKDCVKRKFIKWILHKHDKPIEWNTTAPSMTNSHISCST